MASNDIYQQYHFSNELINIDSRVDEFEKQLELATQEMLKLKTLGKDLKVHSSQYINIWKKHNIDKFTTLMLKAKNLENILNDNF